MVNVVLNLLLSGFAVFAAAYVIPGVEVRDYVTAVIVAIVLGLVNALIKPIVLLLTLPLNVITLGLFTFVINALMVLLVQMIVPGFQVGGFLNALIFSLVLALINGFLHSLAKTK